MTSRWSGLVRCRTFILACVAGLVLWAGARAAAQQAPDSDTETLEWTSAANIRFRAEVATARYRELAATERERLKDSFSALGDAAGTAVQAEMAPIFDEMEAHVPRFADWAYNWWTSWILLARALGWTGEALGEGRFRSLPDRVATRLVEAIQQEFTRRVLRPQFTRSKLEAAADRASASLRAAFARECKAHADSFWTLIAATARRIEKQNASGEWETLPPAEAASVRFSSPCTDYNRLDLAIVGAELQRFQDNPDVEASVNTVIFRLTRPFATKLISFVLLPAIVTAILGSIALPLLRILPGVLSGVIAGALTGASGAVLIGLTASASVDWLLNRTDERLNRTGFEVQVDRAVVFGRDALETKVIEVERRSLERQLLAAVPTIAPPAVAR